MSIKLLSENDARAWFQSLTSSIFSINAYGIGSGQLYEDPGTGFVTEVFETYAYAITAAHVVSAAVELAPESKRDARLRHLGAPDRRTGWQPTLKTHRYMAALMIDGKCQTLPENA
jgi:hypothetical protein